MFAQLIRKSAGTIPTWVLRLLGNFWLPFFGAGINIKFVSPDYREIHVQIKLRWYNKNYVGTQFGGSMYAMTDPFYMMMLINNLGKEYIVWDKAAKIDFIKPGKGTLSVNFSMTEEQIQAIKLKADTQDKYIFDIPVEVKNSEEEIIATVTKTLYVRKKTKTASSKKTKP